MTTASGHVATCEHLVYGKVVQSDGGAIVPGSEHRCTGRSAAFPMELASECHPSKLGVGERDQRRWADCPWAAVGGVVSGIAFAGGEPWVICGRVRERSESGEGVDGRLYTEAHYAIIPAAAYGFDTLKEVGAALVAQPRMSVDMSLPPLVVPRLDDDALPGNWLDLAGVFLRGVMSGEPVNRQDWELRPEGFLRIASWCLAAVPRTLQWRLPVGAGVMTMDRAAALASGMAALGGLRIIGGVVKNESSVDLSLGRAYVEWIAEIARGCTTVADLATRVREALPGLASADAIDLETAWPAAARIVSATVAEKRQLTDLLHALDGGPAAPLNEFIYNRDDYVAALCTRAAEGGGASAHVTALLAATVAAGWTDVWSRVVAQAPAATRPRTTALAMLLGARQVGDPRLLAEVASIEVDAGIEADVVRRLVAGVEASDTGLAWLPLLSQRTGGARWVETWFAAARARLVWLALRDVVAHAATSSPLLNAMGGDPLTRTALELFEGRAVDQSRIIGLMTAATAADRPVVDSLIERAGRTSAWRAFLLGDLALSQGIASSLSESTGGLSASVRDDLVAELVRAFTRDNLPLTGPLMLRALLRQHASLKKSPKSALRRVIVDAIGDPYATALFDSDPLNVVGASRDVAQEYALAELRIGHDIAERLIACLPLFAAEPRDRAVRLLNKWLTDARDSDRRFPLAQAVRRLSGRDDSADITLDDAQRRQVSAAVVAMSFPAVTMWTSAVEEPLLEVVMDLWPKGQLMTLRSEQLASLLQSLLGDPKRHAAWQARITARGWEREPGWRWISGAPRQCNSAELAALNDLPGLDILRLLWRGASVPPTLAPRIKEADLKATLGVGNGQDTDASLQRRIHALATVWQFTTEAPGNPLARPVAVLALQLARESGQDKRAVREAITTEPSILGRVFRATIGAPNTPIELLRAATRTLKEPADEFVLAHWDSARPRPGRARK